MCITVSMCVVHNKCNEEEARQGLNYKANVTMHNKIKIGSELIRPSKDIRYYIYI